MHFDLADLIRSFGYFGVWAIIFAESGLFIGFFLPGDSLLFTAGFLASQPYSLNLWILIAGCFVAAVTGDNVGYKTGKHFGRRLFQRKESWLFNPKNLVRSQQFYEQHGRKTIFLARFLPVVRTFAPVVAGMGAMKYSIFFAYNLLGGAVWTVGLCLLGYYLGQIIPEVDRYLLPIVLVIIVVSVLPSLLHLYQERRRSKRVR
ncbi:MAG: VTT domain-containing protein [Thermosynechococcaceae cyanobacterium]